MWQITPVNRDSPCDGRRIGEWCVVTCSGVGVSIRSCPYITIGHGQGVKLGAAYALYNKWNQTKLTKLKSLASKSNILIGDQNQ